MLGCPPQKPWSLCTARMFPPITPHPVLRLPKTALIIWKDLCGTIKATLCVLKAFLLTCQPSPQSLIMTSVGARAEIHLSKDSSSFPLTVVSRATCRYSSVLSRSPFWRMMGTLVTLIFAEELQSPKVHKQTKKTNNTQTNPNSSERKKRLATPLEHVNEDHCPVAISCEIKGIWWNGQT